VLLPHWLVFLLAIPSAVLWIWRNTVRPQPLKSGDKSWCPACWREIPGIVEKCPGCGGPVAVQKRDPLALTK
jgi:hypothetical protein